MKTRNRIMGISLLIMVSGMFMVVPSQAQPQPQPQVRPQMQPQRFRMQQHMNRAQEQPRLEFTEEQKEQMKKLRLDFEKETRDLRNDMLVLKAELKSLSGKDAPDMKLIHQNIDKQADLQAKLMKSRINQQLEMKKLLTDEQKARLLLRKDIRKRTPARHGYHRF